MTSEEYLEIFKKRIREEPEIPPAAFCECLFRIVSKGENHIPVYENETSVCVNSYILSIVKKYNNETVRVIPTGENSYIFNEAKLIPIPTMEWRFAVLELAFVLKRELGWLGKKATYKTLSIIKRDYGFYLYSVIKNIVERGNRSKEEIFWWNTLLSEACDLFCDMKDLRPDKRIDKEQTKRLIEHIFSIFEFPWVDKEAVFLESEIEEIMKERPDIRRVLLKLKLMSVVNS